jgi:hypothetical protein
MCGRGSGVGAISNPEPERIWVGGTHEPGPEVAFADEDFTSFASRYPSAPDLDSRHGSRSWPSSRILTDTDVLAFFGPAPTNTAPYRAPICSGWVSPNAGLMAWSPAEALAVTPAGCCGRTASPTQRSGFLVLRIS